MVKGDDNEDFAAVLIPDLNIHCRSRPTCTGQTPPHRHSHSAVIADPGLMLVCGGCGNRGSVLSDAYLLDVRSFV